MRLQHQPNKWSCLPTAFAMATNRPVDRVISDIGHDGSEIIFPDLDEPYCRRGFHIQELVSVCMFHNTGVIQIELDPVSEAQGHLFKLPVCKRLDYYLVNYNGVLVGTGMSGTPHAVAWDGLNILDPNGLQYNIKEFNIELFFLITSIH